MGMCASLKGRCSFGELRKDGLRTKCLIDTGDKLPCMSGTCYHLNYTVMMELNDELRLTSVDGSGVEYEGYVELELEVDGWRFLAGFLVLN